MPRRQGQPKRPERKNLTLEDERNWYRRGVDAYLDACRRSRELASPRELAQQFGLSPAAMNRTFKRLFNQTALQYFRSQQLSYAGQLLSRTSQTVDDIAAIASLGPRTTFSRLFVAHFGMTPEAYQQKQRPEPERIKKRDWLESFRERPER